MLNSRTAGAIYIGASALCLLCTALFGLSVLVWAALSIAYCALLVYGSARIGSNFYVEAVCSAATASKEVALTFDDGPDGRTTEEVLRILGEYGAPAAFFLIGRNIAGHRNLVRKIDALGHIIGGHSYSHGACFDLRSASAMSAEFAATDELVYELIGRSINLFRPPYGVTNPALRKAAAAREYTCIGWSIRSLDTSIRDAKDVLARITARIRPGSVILLHDTSANAPEILAGLLAYLRQEHYTVRRLDDMLGVRAYKGETGSVV